MQHITDTFNMHQWHWAAENFPGGGGKTLDFTGTFPADSFCSIISTSKHSLLVPIARISDWISRWIGATCAVHLGYSSGMISERDHINSTRSDHKKILRACVFTLSAVARATWLRILTEQDRAAGGAYNVPQNGWLWDSDWRISPKW